MRRNPLLWVLLLSAPPALADLPGDWYAGVGVGWNYAANVTFDEALSESPAETGGTIDFDFAAPVGSASAGFAFHNGWRVELEAAYRANDTEILYFPESGLEVDPEASDKVAASSLMVNLLRDFELGSALRPFVGIGVGVAEVEFEVGEFSIFTRSTQRPRRAIIDDKATSEAFQLIAGFTVPLTRRLDLAADYRYWQARSVDLEDAQGRQLDTDHETHSVWLSVRYSPGDTRSGGPRRARQTDPAPRPPGYYLAANAGTGFAPDQEIQDNLANFDAYDLGPVVTLAAGYGLGARWRFELEGGWRRNEVEIIDFNPEVGEDRATGSVRASSLMANAFYRLYPRSAVAPYAGFGVGFASADYDVSVPGAQFVDDRASALAYQAIVGVDIAISRRLTFSADYRFWSTAELKLKQPDGSPLQTHHQTHSMSAGLRYSLGVP